MSGKLTACQRPEVLLSDSSEHTDTTIRFLHALCVFSTIPDSNYNSQKQLLAL